MKRAYGPHAAAFGCRLKHRRRQHIGSSAAAKRASKAQTRTTATDEDQTAGWLANETVPP